METLKPGVEQIQTTEHFQQYLAAMGRFHQYSFNNVMLIVAQRADAQRVASFNTWKKIAVSRRSSNPLPLHTSPGRGQFRHWLKEALAAHGQPACSC
jgi:hypothetical protein